MTEMGKLKAAFGIHTTKKLGDPDRWGHYRFTGKNNKTYRIKIMKQVWRFEASHTDGSGWFRISGGKFNNITRLDTLLEIYK